MKRIFIAFIKGCIFSLIITGTAFAQNSMGLYVINDANTFRSALAAIDAKSLNGYSTSEVSEINAKAVKDFSKTFKNAANTQWYKIPDGFVAHFSVNGVEKRTYYDKRGNWHFTITYLDEKALPKDVRGQVKSIYYDYDIATIQKVEVEDKVVYLIHMQDEKTWKTVRVSEDGMDEIENYTK
jgi:hypothetical protein